VLLPWYGAAGLGCPPGRPPNRSRGACPSAAPHQVSSLHAPARGLTRSSPARAGAIVAKDRWLGVPQETRLVFVLGRGAPFGC
jgi:hypothetical protein